MTSNTSQCKLLPYLEPFGGKFDVQYGSQFATPLRFGGLGCLGVETVINRNVDPKFLLYTSQAYPAPFSHNAQRGKRQTDWAIWRPLKDFSHSTEF